VTLELGPAAQASHDRSISDSWIRRATASARIMPRWAL